MRELLMRIWRSAWLIAIVAAIVGGLVAEFLIPSIYDHFAGPAVDITSPVEGQAVEWSPAGHLVTGTYRKVGGNLHLYVLVHPLPTDTWWVGRTPTIIDARNWQAIVFFGLESEGVGDHYELAAIITDKILQEGLTLDLDDFPSNDAKAIIIVERKANEGGE